MPHRIPVNTNDFFEDTINLTISQTIVDEFSLMSGDSVTVYDGDSEWEGTVCYIKEKDVWSIQIHEETYKDLSFPMTDFLPFNLMDKNQARENFFNFMKVSEQKIENFRYSYKLDNEMDDLKFNDDSLEKVSKWISYLTNLILDDDKRIFFRDLNSTSRIKNPEEWYLQAINKDIKNVNPGFVELMFDVSLFYAKYLYNNYKCRWEIGERNTPILKCKFIKFSSDNYTKIKLLRRNSRNLSKYFRNTRNYELKQLYINPFVIVADYFYENLTKEISLEQMHKIMLDEIHEKIDHEMYR